MGDQLGYFRFGLQCLAAHALVLTACSSAKFGSGSASGTQHQDEQNSVEPTPPPIQVDIPSGTPTSVPTIPGLILNSQNCVGLPEKLDLKQNYAAGVATLVMSGSFGKTSEQFDEKCNSTATYSFLASTAHWAPSADFPADKLTSYKKAITSAIVKHDLEKKTFSIDIEMKIQDVTANGQVMSDHALRLTQAATTAVWKKDEGVKTELGNTSTATSLTTDCTLKANGNGPKPGVYAVVLTNPAPCDFLMPKVTVGEPSQPATFTVAIGTYWISSYSNQVYTHVAHPFSTVAKPVGSPNLLDNGFLVIQPDHKTYLLVDGGLAATAELVSTFQSTATVAEQVSQSLGFGSTTLLKPDPGVSSDNYATSTLFKKGSVIAIYDDTPDMSGSIDLRSLTTSVIAGDGVSLEWDASLNGSADVQ